MKSLPINLDKTYNNAMARIQGQVQEHSKLALSALSWISNALRPLQVDELQHALAVQRGDPKLDQEAVKDEVLIISVSAGLVTLDGQSRTIRLVHFTVEEYFRETGQKWFPDAHSQIAETCLTYLSFDTFETGRCRSDRELEDRLEKSCFLDYAARNWGHHAYKAYSTERLTTSENLALEFLRNKHQLSCSSQVMFMPDSRFWNYSQDLPDRVSGIHLTAWFGLISITKKLLEGKVVVDSEDSNLQTPLSHAAENGCDEVVRLLLERQDVKADSQDELDRTPLSHAAENGCDEVVRLLLERQNVKADSQDYNGQTPLLYAALSGHENIVKLLLDSNDVIADSQDLAGRTPLSYAAINGYDKVVRLLLDREDVAADSEDFVRRTPLSYAAENGYETIVTLLLDREDVAADSKDFNRRTPLLYAARTGYYKVVKLLLDRIDVVADYLDDYDQTPLSYAAANGYETIVKLLMDRQNMAADSPSRWIQSSLSLAAEGGHEAVVQLLKEKLKNMKEEE